MAPRSPVPPWIGGPGLHSPACRTKSREGHVGDLGTQVWGARLRSWAFLSPGPLGMGLWSLPLDAVPVQFAQIVRGAGEQPFAFACGKAAPGHRRQVLAGFELAEHRFHGGGPQPVVLPAAGMLQASLSAGGGRILAEVPVLRGARSWCRPGPCPGPWPAARGAAGRRRRRGRSSPR